MSLIDLVPHFIYQEPENHIRIRPIRYLNENPTELVDNYFFIGIHPWDTEHLLNYNGMELYFSHRNFLGLGEIGIDKFKGANLELQYEVFLKQLQLANQYHIQAVLIHCVRSYNLIFKGLNESGFKGNIILHDYNGNEYQTEKLLKRNSFFSYGKSLYRCENRGFKSLDLIDVDRIFLESTKDHSIEDSYVTLAKLKGLTLNELTLKIQDNFKKLFAKD